MKIRITMGLPDHTWAEAVRIFCAATGAGGGMHPNELGKIADEVGDNGDKLYAVVLKSWRAACARSGDMPPGPNPIIFQFAAGYSLSWQTACGNSITLSQNRGKPSYLLFCYDSESTLLVKRLAAAEEAGATYTTVYEDDGHTVMFRPDEKRVAEDVLEAFLSDPKPLKAW